MSDNANIGDDDITGGPTESGADRDQGGKQGQDTGDEPTERHDDLDQGGEGERDTGDES